MMDQTLQHMFVNTKSSYRVDGALLSECWSVSGLGRFWVYPFFVVPRVAASTSLSQHHHGRNLPTRLQLLEGVMPG